MIIIIDNNDIGPIAVPLLIIIVVIHATIDSLLILTFFSKIIFPPNLDAKVVYMRLYY